MKWMSGGKRETLTEVTERHEERLVPVLAAFLAAAVLGVSACGAEGAQQASSIYHEALALRDPAPGGGYLYRSVAFAWKEADGQVAVRASSGLQRLSNGRLLALGRGRALLVTDAQDRQPRQALPVCSDSAGLLALEELGIFLSLCPEGQRLEVRDLETGDLVQIIPVQGRPVQAAADPSGARLYVSTTAGLFLYVTWRAEPRPLRQQLVLWQRLPGRTALLSPDGGLLATWDGTATAWTAAGSRLLGLGAELLPSGEPGIAGDEQLSQRIHAAVFDWASDRLPVLEEHLVIEAHEAPLGRATQLVRLGRARICLWATGHVTVSWSSSPTNTRLVALGGRPTGLLVPSAKPGEGAVDTILVWDSEQERFYSVPISPIQPE